MGWSSKYGPFRTFTPPKTNMEPQKNRGLDSFSVGWFFRFPCFWACIWLIFFSGVETTNQRSLFLPNPCFFKFGNCQKPTKVWAPAYKFIPSPKALTPIAPRSWSHGTAPKHHQRHLQQHGRHRCLGGCTTWEEIPKTVGNVWGVGVSKNKGTPKWMV